jgi:hypothetical protein
MVHTRSRAPGCRPIRIFLLALALLGAAAPTRAAGGPATRIKDVDSAPYTAGFSVDGPFVSAAGTTCKVEVLAFGS